MNTKLSVSDFQADFEKKRDYHTYGDDRLIVKGSINKHQAYASDQLVHDKGYANRIIPKPRRFYFVTPRGLLDLSMVPPHCGLLEVDDDCIRTSKPAPNLKGATKLSPDQVFNLAVKASSKLLRD